METLLPTFTMEVVSELRSEFTLIDSHSESPRFFKPKMEQGTWGMSYEGDGNALSFIFNMV